MEKYIGRKVVLEKIEKTLEFKSLNLPPQKFTHYEVLEGDPVMSELEAEFSNLRVWTPGMGGTCDWDTSRMNVHIDENGTITSMGWG